jgi:hypothetical protein
MVSAMSELRDRLTCARCGEEPQLDEFGRVEQFVEVLASEPRAMLPNSGYKTSRGNVLRYRIHRGCFDETEMVAAR